MRMEIMCKCFGLQSTIPYAEHILGHLSVFTEGLGEGNGTPFQYSCLENPMDGGAW